jgi:small redox-active disulfide protein 2
MEIKVLGPGCANCHRLHELVERAVREGGIDAKVESVTDMTVIMRHTISTPGLLIDGRLVHAGKPLPGLDKIKELIKG